MQPTSSWTALTKATFQARGFFCLHQAFGYLRKNEAAEAVVQRAANQLVLIHQHGAVAINAHVPHAQPQVGHLLVGGSAHVNVNFPDLGLLLPTFAQVDGRIPRNAHHFPLAAQEAHAAPARDGRIRSAHAFHVQEALRRNVADHEADLIGMGLNHQGGSVLLVRMEGGPRIPVSVALDILRVLPHLIRPNALGVYLKTGRTGSLQKFR